MRVLGIDIATRKTGIVIYDTETKQVVSRETVEFPVAKFNTYLAVSQGVFSFFRDFAKKNSFDAAVVEDVLYGGAHLKVALSIHASRTACVLGVLEAAPEAKVFFVSPQSVKYHFAAKRGAKKPEMRVALTERYPALVTPDWTEDEIDALALGEYWSQTGKTSASSAVLGVVKLTVKKKIAPKKKKEVL